MKEKRIKEKQDWYRWKNTIARKELHRKVKDYGSLESSLTLQS